MPLARVIYFAARVHGQGFYWVGAIGLAIGVLWLVLATYDLLTGHRFLDWLYS